MNLHEFWKESEHKNILHNVISIHHIPGETNSSDFLTKELKDVTAHEWAIINLQDFRSIILSHLNLTYKDTLTN